MALEENTGGGMVMPVAPMYGGGSGNGSGNGFGEGGWWILLLFILLGGWGNNGNGNNSGFSGGGGVGGLYPWMNQSEQINDGFRDQMLFNSVNGIQSAVTNGFSDVQMALCNGFAGVEMGANARQMADMQQNFALQSQLASCCCENRLASADLKYTIATENCADRQALNEGVRDIVDSQTRGTQVILDKLCQLELDNKNTRISELERQLTMANLNASQIAQTAQIQRGQVAEVDALYQRLKDCPVPTQPVYGSQPIFTCPQNTNNCGCGCGCGCNGGF